jgi:hypothetical protein
LKWDAFLSYGHADDASPPCWVRNLYRDVNARLMAVAPSLQAKIWADFVELPGHGTLADHIRRALAESEIFVSIVSPSWVASFECQKELDIFLKRPHLGEPKVVKLAKLPLEDGQRLPDLLSRSRGYDLHNGLRGRAMELKGEAREEAIGNLAYELRDLILQARRGPRATVALLATADRADERETGLLELRRLGFEVIPGAQLPRTEQQRKRALQELVERADFTVLLLGQRHSQDLELVYSQLLERWKATESPRCLSSLPDTAQDPQQAALIQHIRSSENPAFDRMGVSAGEWLSAATDQLQELLAARRKPTVYLRYTQEQHPTAQRVRDQIPKDFEVLDPYDCATPNLAQVDSQACELAHGILVFAMESDLLTRTLNEMKRAVRSVVGVYLDVLDQQTVMSPPDFIAQNERLVLVRAQQAPAQQVAAGGRNLSLPDFLTRVALKARDR